MAARVVGPRAVVAEGGRLAVRELVVLVALHVDGLAVRYLHAGARLVTYPPVLDGGHDARGCRGEGPGEEGAEEG